MNQPARPFRLPLYKRMLNHPLIQNTLTFLASLLLRLCFMTFRIHVHLPDASRPFYEGTHQAVYCFWHGRMLLLPFYMPKGRAMQVLISHHRDGELIARFIRHFGVQSIRGSSSRGAREALHQLIAALGRGDNVSITPDGPRGPAQTAQKGAALLAKRAAFPMVPVSYAAARCWRLKSWDHFIIPKPFSPVYVCIGEPIILGDAPVESWLNALEQSLNQLTREADAMAKEKA